MAKMIYVKSVLAGLVALAVSVYLLPIGFIIFFFFRPPPESEGGGEVAWDLVSLFANYPIAWIVVVAIFALGFSWEFRRASR